MQVISNSTLLIHLAKLNLLYILKKLFDTVIIPQIVYKETVIDGIHLGKADAYIIADAIKEGWIRIHRVNMKEVKDVARRYKIDESEASVKYLAMKIQTKLILINERRGRKILQQQGFNVIGTLGIITRAVKMQVISINQARDALYRMLANPQEYWISPSVIKKMLRILLKGKF